MGAIDLIIYSRWSTASPLAGSGFDSRSSDNGLLSIMYGSVERASGFDWLNAGRTLVDKTYIQILWQAKQLPANGITHHDIAPLLELFIREYLQPVWPEIASLNEVETKLLAISLVERAAESLFGSCYQEEAASWLLFYLCPQLPVFPVTDTLRSTILHRDNRIKDDYAGYHQACSMRFNEVREELLCPLPLAHYGTVKEIAIIDQIINNSDWWLRHCFVQQMAACDSR